MDLELLRNRFNVCTTVSRIFENALSRLEEQIEILNAGPPVENMEGLMDMASNYREDIEDYRDEVVDLYKLAVEYDMDVDGSRLLMVYRFIYRNSDQLHDQLALVNVPNESNAVWGIIILTAIMFLYAAV
ncbi:hypothetical protein CAEBREN_00694 [Caenorhabditis brenneri]|uniref:Uncharacterized protein n=1 Tax=Caenorhabditis brenneri TaxID=135651 RepID=G0MNC6_CAEBE|nr:hypothetical protein CAEBREN_00694 [Caenorhabditis brenneri]